MKALRSWLAALCIVACALVLRAGADFPQSVPSTNDSQAFIRGQVANRLGFERFSLQAPEVMQTGDTLSGKFEIDGQAVTLQLTKYSVRSPHFQVFAQKDASGELTSIEAPPVRTYDGTVLEWPGSRVAASYHNDELNVMIHDGERRFAIEPVKGLDIDVEPGSNDHVVYDVANSPATGLACGVTEQAQALMRTVDPDDIVERRALGGPTQVAEVAYDADFSFRAEEGGSTPNAILKIEQTTNNVRLDYNIAAINMTFLISAIVVREDVNDPYSSPNASSLLNTVEAVWDTAPENSIPRDCVQLYTGINLTPPPIGIAFLGVGCFAFDAYSLIEANAIAGTAARTALSSHELGHIWGAPHCDGCGACTQCCRIMCSGFGGCTGIISSFGCNTENAISGYIGAFGSCLDDEPPPGPYPFCEDLASPVIQPERWAFVKGALASGAAINPPSPPFVFELDALGSGEHQDDELRSNDINLLGQSNVVLSYYTQHSGVEAGETLTVEYYDNMKLWQEVNLITSNGTDQEQFVFHSHTLPSTALHLRSKFRFRTDVNSSSDNWFIDDISLDCFAPPVCKEPCTDGQACTVGDTCVTEFACSGTAVDCSAFGDDCNVASCDAQGADGNCNILTPANDGGACSGGDGFCESGSCVLASDTGRIFMAVDGQQNGVNAGGPTAGLMGAGGTTTIAVFIEENSGSGVLFNGYQIILPFTATPLPGATGTVTYVDNVPGNGSLGDSVVLDSNRGDWAFNGEPVLPPNYNETPAIGLFGVVYNTIAQTGVDLSGDGVLYLADFEVQASGDASGDFEIAFNLPPLEPPHTNLFNPFGAIYQVAQTQPLILTVGDIDCFTASDCGDINGDGLRDDPCKWYECAGLQCSDQDRIAGQADMGGGNGACPIDNACDGNDRFHGLNCFSNLATTGVSPYPCEPNPPAAINIDAGGPSVSCILDGVCDGNDVFHALNCFSNIDSFGNQPYPCGCAGPAPSAPQDATRRKPQTATGIQVRGPKAVQPGDLVDIDLHLTDALQALRGYQLHVEVSGASGGAFELVDVAVHSNRQDYVFADAPQTWTAYNTRIGQVLVGMDAPEGISTAAGAYAATFTYRVPLDAAGSFIVDLRYDELSANPTDRTFLFGENAAAIGVHDVAPATIRVESRRRRTR